MARAARIGWAILVLVGPLTAAPAFAAYPWVTCRANFVVTYTLDGPGSCTPPEKRPSRLVNAFDCETGALCIGIGCPCNTADSARVVAFGGYPVGSEPCEEDPPAPVKASTCGEEELPKQCSDTPTVTTESAGLLGDPIGTETCGVGEEHRDRSCSGCCLHKLATRQLSY